MLAAISDFNTTRVLSDKFTISALSGPGSSPGQRHCASQSTQVFRWVPANLMRGVTLRWTSIQPKGGVEIL